VNGRQIVRRIDHIVEGTEERCDHLVLALRDPDTDLSTLCDVLGGTEIRAVAA
jgi:hypothetical protein